MPSAPPDAPPGTCWARQDKPAVIETVTEQRIREVPGAAPLYSTVTTQRIASPRETRWIEVACAGDLPPDYIASLQRALQARGHFAGPVNGVMDAQTGAAIRAYNRATGGPDAPVLPLAAARALGLVPTPAD